MNKQKPKYRIGWPTWAVAAFGVIACLVMATDNACFHRWWRMADNISFAALILAYMGEMYAKVKSWNVASETIRINDELADINTKLGEAATSALAAYDAQTRKLNGMKNTVRVAADALRMARAKVKLLDKECGRLHQKLEAYENEEVRV